MNRKIKAMLVMPLIVCPLAAILFYAFGGGSGSPKQAPKTTGLNTYLPSATLDPGNGVDKMSLYEKARTDSVTRNRQRENERGSLFGYDEATSTLGAVESPFSADPGLATGGLGSSDRTAQRVAQKIEALKALLATQPAADTQHIPTHSIPFPMSGGQPQLQELEQMMSTMGERPPEDQELKRMESIIDKIMDIEDPDRVRNRARKNRRSGPVKLVTTVPLPSVTNAPADSLQTDTLLTAAPVRFPQFYGMTHRQIDTTRVNTIAAVVHQTTTLVNGGNLKLRLTQDVFIDGQRIPAGTFVTGVCNLSGERLLISVSAIQYRSMIYSVDLTAYGLDGVAGIVMEGSITRDAAKQGSDQAIQSIAMASLDPSVAAQAASAGIEAAKGLLSRKVKLIRVTARADYPILLKPSEFDKPVTIN